MLFNREKNKIYYFFKLYIRILLISWSSLPRVEERLCLLCNWLAESVLSSPRLGLRAGLEVWLGAGLWSGLWVGLGER